MRRAAGIGPPDVVKATCPVRGALGGNPLSRGSMDAVLRLHGLPICSPARRSSWISQCGFNEMDPPLCGSAVIGQNGEREGSVSKVEMDWDECHTGPHLRSLS